MLFLLLAQAQTAPAAAPGAGAGIGGLIIPMTLVMVIMYFLMIRPQKKRQLEQKKLIDSMKTGDKVITNAGIHGLISNLKDTTVIVKVADNVKIEMEKSAIATVMKADG
jgi:preprotein translocase subunit YajC